MWRFVGTTLHGDGTETNPVLDIPLSSVTIIKPMSGPPTLEATLSPEQPVALAAGRSCLYALHDDAVVSATIVDTVEEIGAEVRITSAGFVGMARGAPWVGDPRALYGVDIGAVFGMVWDHLQSQPGGNLGLTRPDFTTGVTVGVHGSAEGVTPVVQDAPFTLSASAASDLSQTLATLASAGLEYREVHGLGGPHTIEAGSRVGRDRTGLRFEVGVNVTSAVAVWDKASSAPTEVVVIGSPPAATGGAPVQPVTPWGMARVSDPQRLRRVVVVTDSTITDTGAATARAQALLASYAGDRTGYTITVCDTPQVRLTAVDVGDTIAVHGTRWAGGQFAGVGRISSITYHPDDGTADIDVVPVGRISQGA